jgi:hypothetical protein
MQSFKIKNHLFLLLSFTLFFVQTPSANAKELEIITGIYAWLPSVYGKLKFEFDDGSEEPERVNPNDVFYSLNGLFMGTIELRKDNFVFYTDIVYVDISKSEEIELFTGSKRDTTLGLSGWQSSYLAGYTLINKKNFSLDILGGVRYFSLEVTADLEKYDGTLTHIDYYKGLLDAIIATRGIYTLSKNWFIPFHFDFGAGTSKATFQAMSGIGYKNSWGDITVVYKHIAWYQERDKLVNNISLSGATIGYSYHF